MVTNKTSSKSEFFFISSEGILKEVLEKLVAPERIGWETDRFCPGIDRLLFSGWSLGVFKNLSDIIFLQF